MDLDAGRVVQHLQVLKHRLPDLLQVLRSRQSHRRFCHGSTVSGRTCGRRPCSPHLSGVLVLYPGADVRVQREVWGKVLKVFCGNRGGGEKKVRGHFLNC